MPSIVYSATSRLLVFSNFTPLARTAVFTSPSKNWDFSVFTILRLGSVSRPNSADVKLYTYFRTVNFSFCS